MVQRFVRQALALANRADLRFRCLQSEHAGRTGESGLKPQRTETFRSTLSLEEKSVDSERAGVMAESSAAARRLPKGRSSQRSAGIRRRRTSTRVKRRTRRMGRCQSGFCLPAVWEILAKVWGVPLTAVTKKGGGSYILTGRTKGTETNEAARIRAGAAAGTEPPQHLCADEAAFMSRAKNENGGVSK